MELLGGDGEGAAYILACAVVEVVIQAHAVFGRVEIP
jgi:hypothetical protein